MGYKIITDSTIDMDHKMIEELGLTVVPLRFTIDGKTYKDKADLSDMPTETFYAKLREGKMSTTSQINADEFTRVFEPVLQGGEDVLYIAFSSGLSGTCQSAFIARDELKEKYPERKIYVFDSLCASLGEGLLVYHAAMLKRAGTDIDSLYKWLGENVLKLWCAADGSPLMRLCRKWKRPPFSPQTRPCSSATAIAWQTPNTSQTACAKNSV